MKIQNYSNKKDLQQSYRPGRSHNYFDTLIIAGRPEISKEGLV